MTSPSVYIESIGCKLNTHEAELTMSLLESAGFVRADDPGKADYIVFNTCTVTGRADQRTRNLSRAFKRRNPASILVVTGCSAQLRSAELQGIEEIDYIRGNTEKQGLAELLAALERGESPPRVAVSAVFDDAPLRIPLIRDFKSLSRPFIKIQDGCNNSCSYCTIPAARGPQRSCSAVSVLEQTRVFAEKGFGELVLSGVHLGAYGRDLDGEIDLAGLLERMIDIPGCPRIRLSSMEPNEFNATLEDLLVRTMKQGRVCRHLHIPLQSGSNSVLARMRRNYCSEEYAGLVERLVSAVPGLAIGADVLVGFPGESDGEFEETKHFLESLPLAYLHVFSYSRRPGTDAATMKNQVPPDEKKRRSAVLRGLSDRKRSTFFDGQVGKILDCVYIRPVDSDGKRWEVLSDNYIKLFLSCDGACRGRTLRARMTGHSGRSGTAVVVADS